jgi:CheY-like chemotaxis protein
VCVQLVVADTGKGIPEEDLLRVCEPFESSAGLGLGLAMVRRLVESMEGTFRLESQVGAGTKAIMTFPLERVVEGGRLLEPAAEVSAEPASDRARILVVEDNAINQKVALGFLKMIGCDTATADNGQQGIEALQGEEFDLVLMDCMMPVLDGYKATTSVRAGAAGEEHTSIPIIALTADDSPGARQACLKAGMDDYLTKPLRAERLRALLRIWLPPALRPAAE